MELIKIYPQNTNHTYKIAFVYYSWLFLGICGLDDGKAVHSTENTCACEPVSYHLDLYKDGAGAVEFLESQFWSKLPACLHHPST